MSGHYRNADGTLGHPAFAGHYTCEGRVRRVRSLFRLVQCHAPAVVAVDEVMQPEGVSLTWRYCAACARRYVGDRLEP